MRSLTIEQIGEDFGLSGSTFKIDLRLIDAPPDPPGSRKEALGRNILHNITVTLEAFRMG